MERGNTAALSARSPDAITTHVLLNRGELYTCTGKLTTVQNLAPLTLLIPGMFDGAFGRLGSNTCPADKEQLTVQYMVTSSVADPDRPDPYQK